MVLASGTFNFLLIGDYVHFWQTQLIEIQRLHMHSSYYQSKFLVLSFIFRMKGANLFKYILCFNVSTDMLLTICNSRVRQAEDGQLKQQN